ncbi:magnesium transporter NIPA-domain-containing protein [Protomyces lactucae-debilis]|uniref:Magnesium transporter NIPA-domain-containing protein n=1 Tax=Protomyces lactucae-debilis TaxID=2754530 RepID=A0A1Y2FQP1_PROLT|nr:magnesium transporter NIPA-domain-containing protein [Protomyces lactucae-debilis]ORY86259.1 magnesium transporter NIPA-domain-containing protein [Protomyces lactucae-debilis]
MSVEEVQLPSGIDSKYIGLGLAISSSLAIGTSFIITKKGLIDAQRRQGFDSEDSFGYLQNPIWWAGMVTMIVGEVANFAAYTFAPAILVTPLGALSVLIGAVLASIFLKEQLGVLGKLGCALCLLGSVIIVLHAPADKEVETVDEILDYAMQPGFLFYCILVSVFAVVMIYRVAPRLGKTNPLIYISICSTVGSVSVMSIKGFGIALKLTFAGNNQLTHPSTWVFAIVVIVCILTQMNYFNKALDQFDTSIVNPLYYVTFTTFTLIASFILFRGFNTSDAVNTISLLAGFMVIFSGVYLLNASRLDPDLACGGKHNGAMDGIPMDNGIASLQTRRSIQLQRSSFSHADGAAGEHMLSTFSEQGRASQTLDDDEQSLGLSDLTESDEEAPLSAHDTKAPGNKRHARAASGSGHHKKSGSFSSRRISDRRL